ncbi:MAG: ribonuclease Y [Spirochaetia bacterium]|jgi:ribonuclease Y|uniref:Ribonuclease Y n=1 Tax=uncultured spirochete TaxID=156406 RepID=A0A3P3XGQ0_9SPIR|nr:ribonuclease Y [Rectinema subterraneum]MDQ7796867.1 ribonuclease Y [Spirochaetia bacterium]SLM11186.1 Ribonuclease Y [uncultured spirochete]HCX96499.1 ribonuclease Y [Spirochaetaceae bacterium]
MAPFVWYIVLPLAGLILGWMIRWLYARFQLSSAEREAEHVLQDAIKEAEAKKKELLVEAKDQIIRERNQQERELRDRRIELQKYERRVLLKEENLDAKLASIERIEANLKSRENAIAEKEAFLAGQEERYAAELERVSGFTAEEAKKLIIQNMENEARHDAQVLINKIDQEAQLTADKKAKDILLTTIQRIATESTAESTVSSVSLPSDEMKGRIIGREGRNIRTLETLTGVDIIIDDTPEAVVISCFDPIQREIAKISLERLIADGRIHPARIEEMVQKVTREITQKLYDEGEKVVFDLGLHNMAPELIRAVGRLYYRTSYGQNVLMHSKEVAVIAGLLAAELGLNREIAKRGALLHDIGKGIVTDSDMNHAEIGTEIAKKFGEDPRVINAIAAHHNDVEPTCPESVIVQIADAISAARPGARRETLDNYIKRLEDLEAVAESFSGVEKAFAIQAGRELRIIVNNEQISDDQAKDLCKSIAKKIESDLRYPGRIKVTIIRETRIVEYAR